MKRILHDHGIEPAPERAPTNAVEDIPPGSLGGPGGVRSVTVEVLTLAGLRRYLVFFVIELKTRRVTIAGIHPQPGGVWMEQMARNLTDPVDGFLRTARHLIHDRDPLYTQSLDSGRTQPYPAARRRIARQSSGGTSAIFFGGEPLVLHSVLR